MEILRDMLGRNLRQNLHLVASIATKYAERLGTMELITLFEDYKSPEGLLFFLSSIVNQSTDPEVHFKYIQAAARVNPPNIKELERVCKDSTVYDAVQVKNFLIEAKLPDPRPLIHVCDRFDFVDEMVGYLYSNQLHKYIEVYVQRVSPQKTPIVVGKLLDVDCNEDFIRTLLNALPPQLPSNEIIEQVERRNRLRLLQPWLETRIQMGSQEVATHNAIGKIYIQLNRDPVSFLTQNIFYDPRVLGAFCEKLDPSLAFVAYKRAGGACDAELIKVSLESGLYKDLARYLVERQDPALWAQVLAPLAEGETESASRRTLIDQIVQVALPENKSPEALACTVKAFMDAGMNTELIELLERVLLQPSEFSSHGRLQNLLLITAMKVEKEKVSDYINRLDNFDGADIARIAESDEFKLYEDALSIYNKFAKKTKDPQVRTKMNESAVTVLVDKIQSLDRAKEFAERVNEASVWSIVAKAQLDQGHVADAITSYIKAQNPNHYTDVIRAAKNEENYSAMVPYLQMARRQIKEASLDTHLIYAYARTNKLGELEDFLSAPNVAKIDVIGEECFKEEMYEAAKLLFASINNNAKLALCYIHMQKYHEAIDSATKANAIPTWKAVNAACLKAKKFDLANIAGLRIIIQPDHLDELISLYEKEGHPDQLITLLEQGRGQEAVHSGIYTELGVLYSKYHPEKLMDHIKGFGQKVQVPKLLKAIEKALLWTEAVYLYNEHKQYDAAVRTMIDHPVAFSLELFLSCVREVKNAEVHHKAINFFIEQHPLQLARLLQSLQANLDHSRVVHSLKKHDAVPLAVDYLKYAAKEDLTSVNEALNEYFIDEEDHEALKQNIDDHQNFDQISLAMRLEKHELLEFRRLASYLYKKNKRYEQSIKLSKEDRMYKDAIETARDSADRKLAQDVLTYFVEVDDKASFASTLFTCYDLITPDVALELAWRNQYHDYAMPYLVQYIRHLHEKVETLEEKVLKAQAPAQQEDASVAAAAAAMAGAGGMYEPSPLMGGMLAIANEAYVPGGGYGMAPPMGGMGMGAPYGMSSMPPPPMGAGMGGGFGAPAGGFGTQPAGFGGMGGPTGGFF